MTSTSITPAPMGPRDRKAELYRAGLEQLEIARACNVEASLVSRVVRGRSLQSDQGRRVATYIAGVLRLPLEVCFPELPAA